MNLKYLFPFLVLFNVASVRSFNVDTLNYITHNGEKNSMFGFTVAQYKPDIYKGWVLVGAPKADTGRLPAVKRPGAVFKCDINRPYRCAEIEFDVHGNNNDSVGQLDEKSNQWFGATLQTSRHNDTVVACAPRYVYLTQKLNTNREPVGTCYVGTRRLSQFLEFAPARTKLHGHAKTGYGQAGFSADLSNDGERLFIGAPGCYYWQGQVYSVDPTAVLPFPVPPTKRFLDSETGQVYSQNTYSRPEVISTPEDKPFNDNSYLGYSMATGDFGSGPQSSDIAVGMPRGENLAGKVVIMTKELTNIFNISGEQFGSYFGHTLCTVDLDGDRKDDLVIGAPLYTDISNNDGSYENGRVYIVYQGPTQNGVFSKMYQIDGKISKGRFGFAIASLGDINRDGFGDVAISAPYENEAGAVYIFHGSREGILKEASQVIKADKLELTAGFLTTFGFSLAGGKDLDNNQYPDLVVGAYDSDAALFFRTRPVVKMDSYINFEIKSKQISLDDKKCTLKDGRTQVPCFNLTSCMKYTGIGVNDTLDFIISIILDSKKTRDQRMYFSNKEGVHSIYFNANLVKDIQSCTTNLVYIKPDIRDKLTVLEAEVKYSLLGEKDWEESSRHGRRHQDLFPILDRNLLFKKDTIAIKKNCGDDDVCIPDLQVTVEPSVKRYLMGSGENLWIDVVVKNAGEDSFESVFIMPQPNGLSYVKKVRTDGEKEIPIQCSAPNPLLNNNTLRCDIGNPLPREKMVHFRLIFQPSLEPGSEPRYEFNITVNSTNPENKETLSDNIHKFTVPIWVNTSLIITGSSLPAEVHYNESLYTSEEIIEESQIGPQVIHTYSIRNRGPSNIKEATVLIYWPSYTLAGDHLLYLLEEPELSGNIKCQAIPEINPLKLKVTKKKKTFTSSSYHSASSSSPLGTVNDYNKNSQSSFNSYSSSSSSSATSSSSYGKSKSGYKKNGKSNRKDSSKEAYDYSEEKQNKKKEDEAVLNSGDISVNERKKQVNYDTKENDEYDHRTGLTVKFNLDNGYISERGRVEKTGSGHVQIGSGHVQTGSGHVQTGSNSDYDYRHTGLSFSSPVDSDGRRIEENIAKTYGANLYPGSDTRKFGIKDEETNIHNRFDNKFDSNANRHLHTNVVSNEDGTLINVIPDGQPNVYEKEEHHYRNSSWNSADRGGPKTFETSSWTINDNGTLIRGGANDYDVKPSAEDELVITDEDIAAGRAKVIKTEEHRIRNKTWSSSREPPKIYETTNWKITENGNVRNGTNINVYEDDQNFGLVGKDAVGVSNQDETGSYDGSSHKYFSGHSGTSYHGSSSDNRSRTGSNDETRGSATERSRGSSGYDTRGSAVYDASRTSSGYDVRGSAANDASRTFSGYDARGSAAIDASHTSGGYGARSSAANDASRTSSGYDTRGSAAIDTSRTSSGYDARGSSAYDASQTSRGYGARGFAANAASRASSGARGSSAYDASRISGGYDSARESGSSRGITNTEGSLSGSFDALSAIARGPTDGVARTYSLDVLGESNRNEVGRIQQGSSSRQSYGTASSSAGRSSQLNRDQNIGEYDNISMSGRSGAASGNGDRSNKEASETFSNKEVGYTSSSIAHREGYFEHATSGSQHYNQGGYRKKEDGDDASVEKKFELYGRLKRETNVCGSAKCTLIKCTVGPLYKEKNSEALISIRSLVFVRTINKFAHNPTVNVSSQVVGRIVATPHFQPDYVEDSSAEVSTVIKPKAVGEKADVVPLWVVVSAACAGAIILMLLVYLLYKCGFFKRNRPESQEKEPLNRNGHFQSGDEAL